MMDMSLFKQVRRPISFLAVLLAFIVAVESISEELPVVNLSPNQTLRGEWLQTFRTNRKIAAYVAIPYAEPPTGNLRFQSPQEAKNWTGELKLGPVGSEPLCPQFVSGKIVGDEDCLKLSVYSPENAEEFPVLVWIHGGEFSQGGAREYGPQLLLDRDVILVTVNYRLGALGFLSTEDEIVAGNWGLKDQKKAIQWVRKNIEAFGGDPEKVNVGGIDAGGVSAHLHTLSQLSRRLLHGAISMSGTALRPDVPVGRGAAKRRALRLADRLGCVSANLTSVEAVGCLRGAAVEALLKVDLDEGWAPVVEDFVEDVDVAFLEEAPVATLANAMSHDVPWLTGFTENDGSERAADLLNDLSAISALANDFKSQAGDLLGYASTAPDPAEVSIEIRDFYFEDGNLTSKTLKEMLLDAWHLAPADEAVRLHAAHSPAPTYLYFFTGGKTSSKEELVRSLLPPPTSKSDDYSDKATSELVLDLWANFISEGEPTSDKSKVEWQKAESNDLEFVEIAENGKLLQGKGLLGHRAYFWSSLPRSARHASVLKASIPGNSKKTGLHTEL